MVLSEMLTLVLFYLIACDPGIAWHCVMKGKDPTFRGSCLIVLFKEEVAWALREKWQARQLDQGRDNDHSEQVWPGALLQGEDCVDGGAFSCFTGDTGLRVAWTLQEASLLSLSPLATAKRSNRTLSLCGLRVPMDGDLAYL